MLLAEIVARIRNNPPRFEEVKQRKPRAPRVDGAQEKALLAALRDDPDLLQKLFGEDV